MIFRVFLEYAVITIAAVLTSMQPTVAPTESCIEGKQQVQVDALDEFQEFYSELMDEGIQVSPSRSEVNGVIEATVSELPSGKLVYRVYAVVDEETGLHREIPEDEALVLMGLK